MAALVGFVTLTGIATRNGILKISHYLHLHRRGRAFGDALVLRGARERLTPVLMTALTAALALVPLLLRRRGAGQTEILHPVAVVIFGGLVSSTLLDVLLTPLLFRRYGGPALASSIPILPKETHHELNTLILAAAAPVCRPAFAHDDATLDAMAAPTATSCACPAPGTWAGAGQGRPRRRHRRRCASISATTAASPCRWPAPAATRCCSRRPAKQSVVLAAAGDRLEGKTRYAADPP